MKKKNGSLTSCKAVLLWINFTFPYKDKVILITDIWTDIFGDGAKCIVNMFQRFQINRMAPTSNVHSLKEIHIRLEN